MKQIIMVAIFSLIIGGLGASTVLAAKYGDQFLRATLWGVVESGKNTEVYRLQDPKNGATCYIAQFGSSGVSMSCVK